jgi:pimeloyl-ACP methyl ester carboxylesterase
LTGLGFDRAGWIPVLPELEREFRIVLIDSRGTGQSTTKEYRFTVGDLAGDVVAVLASGQIPSAHMLGVSLGGMIAQEVAIHHPGRVDRLVLACTTPAGRSATQCRARRCSGCERRRTSRPKWCSAALSPGTLKEHPELVARIIRNQAGKRADYEAWQALARAGSMYIGGAGPGSRAFGR